MGGVSVQLEALVETCLEDVFYRTSETQALRTQTFSNMFSLPLTLLSLGLHNFQTHWLYLV